MNQILVTEKLYITPELKKKKKAYKFYFFLSVFLVCILVSFYIYAEVDRNKSEEASQAILDEFNQNIDNSLADSNILVAILNDTEDTSSENNSPTETPSNTSSNKNNKFSTNKVETTSDGFRYITIGSINIPKINVSYPILDGETDSVAETEALLKISPTKFWGVDPNEIGNFSLVGHNYRNSKFFSKVPTLENGDKIEITDNTGRTLTYTVFDKYEVVPSDTSCTAPNTNGTRDLTLITCTNDSQLRVIVKARAN